MTIKHTLPSGTLAIRHSGWTYIAKAYILCILLLCLAGCHKQPDEADDRLLHAEAIIHTHPDSALHLLQAIPYPEDFDGLNQGLYALLRTQAEYKNYIPVSNDSLISIAVDYFSQTPDSLRKAWSCFYAGQVYRDNKEYERAIDFFEQGVRAGKKTNDYNLLDLLYYHWGVLIYKEKPYEEGLEKLLKAKTYAEKAGKKTSVIYTIGTIAWSYLWMEDYPKSLQCLEEALKLAEETNDMPALHWLFYRLSVISIANKDYNKGLEYINKSIALSDYTSNKEPTSLLKGKIFYDLQLIDSAKYYLNKSIEHGNLYSIATYHLSMTRLYKQLNRYKEALLHHEQYSNYIDSISQKEEDERVMEIQKKYDMTKVKYENIKLKKTNLQRGIAIMVVVVALLLFIITVFFVYTKKKREREAIIQSKNNLLAQNMLQLQQKSNKLLQTEQHVNEKENELETYKAQLQTLKLEILKMTEITRKIENLNKLNQLQKNKRKADILLSQQDKTDLFDALNFCFDGFEKRLRSQYSKLTDEDILLCCLLKMNINNQDIVILLETNDEALKKRKYRIKHDKITDMGDLSLSDFLANF